MSTFRNERGREWVVFTLFIVRLGLLAINRLIAQYPEWPDRWTGALLPPTIVELSRESA